MKMHQNYNGELGYDFPHVVVLGEKAFAVSHVGTGKNLSNVDLLLRD